jgi:hypothetical protein
MRRHPQPGEIVLPAYDIYNAQFYNDEHAVRISRKLRREVLAFFETTIPHYIRDMPTYDVVLIERATDSYYGNGACADRGAIYQTSGSQRRSLTNHEVLREALASRFGRDKFKNIVLERSSIYFQYHVFRHARIVIAQHGAALSNLFFMSEAVSGTSRGNSGGGPVSAEGSTARGDPPASSQGAAPPTSFSGVVEICPPWSREFQHFRNLAQHCGVRYEAVWQPSDHSDVDVPAVLAAVDRLAAEAGMAVTSEPSGHEGEMSEK